jgi:excisionase family DNA binding protein
MNPDEIMTVEQVARYLKLKPQTVYKWAQEGQLPGAKLGKEWRFRRRLIDQWVDSAIHLSPGGFNLILQQSRLAAREKGVEAGDLERIIKDLEQ